MGEDTTGGKIGTHVKMELRLRFEIGKEGKCIWILIVMFGIQVKDGIGLLLFLPLGCIWCTILDHLKNLV